MKNSKEPFFKRLTSIFATGLAVTFQVIFGCVVLLFVVGSCVKDGKNFLSCIGIGKSNEDHLVEFRAWDPDNEVDYRFAEALVKLATAADMDLDKLRIAIAVDQQINAVTIGTDTFVLFEGLSSLSDEELDAVMAHEVAHAIKGHSDKSTDLVNAVSRAAQIAGAILGQDDETTDEVTSWTVDFVFAPYSRSQEREADLVAVDLLIKAGYPLDAVDVMCDALDSLAKRTPDAGGGFL
ncbi:MAG: M48 family metalloprotease, partial [Armatimonadetes bacterium]|nr:M48 family metalloprotease [Armatimonadota bacterium]